MEDGQVSLFTLDNLNSANSLPIAVAKAAREGAFDAGLLYSQAHFEMKVESKADRNLGGFASTDEEDRGGHVVNQAALEKAGKGWLARGAHVFYNHLWGDNSLPIGKGLEWRATKHKTWIKAKIGRDFDIPVNNTLMNVNNIWESIVQGFLNSFSVAFLGDSKEIDGRYELIAKDLLEISVVNIPQSRGAQFSVAKALRFGTDLERCCSCGGGGGVEVVEALSEDKLDAVLASLAEPEIDVSRLEEGIDQWIKTLS